MPINLKISEPKIKTEPRQFEEHGFKRDDPYFWLREKTNPEVRKVVEDENAYLAEVLKPLDPIREKIFEEMKGRIERESSGVPVPNGPYDYSWKIPLDAQYRSYFRIPSGNSGKEEVLIDLNQMVGPGGYISLQALNPSPDHHWIAYSIDRNGSEKYQLRFRSPNTGVESPEMIENTQDAVAWASDNKTVFYTKIDDQDRPYQIWKHVLGTDVEKDVLVFEEKNPKFFVGCRRSKTGKYVIISLESKVTSEAWVLDATKPNENFRCLIPRKEGVLYSVEHAGDCFLVITNDEEKNFRALKIKEDAKDFSNAIELLRGDITRQIEDVNVFERFWVFQIRDKGVTRFEIWDKNQTGGTDDNPLTWTKRTIQFEDQSFAASTGSNPTYSSNFFRIHYSSPRTPERVFDCDLTSGQMILRKETVIPSGHDPENYGVERIEVTSHDGVKVPVTLLWNKNRVRGKPGPVLLYGYGSYGISTDPSFSSTAFSLVDRGFIFAKAHIRGGGDLGRHWYEDGKFLKKKNTFHDFIAAAEALVKSGDAEKGGISILGGSAGGLLVGAVMNMRPDLFRSVIGQVPFVDVLNTMLDETLLLTPTEFDEWGNPKDRTYYDYIKSYSPYDNLTKQDYPALFLTAGWNDPRVTYWEPVKFIARFRDMRTNQVPALLYTELGAGHGGASGRFDRMKETAMVYSFILDCHGIT